MIGILELLEYSEENKTVLNGRERRLAIEKIKSQSAEILNLKKLLSEASNEIISRGFLLSGCDGLRVDRAEAKSVTQRAELQKLSKAMLRKNRKIETMRRIGAEMIALFWRIARDEDGEIPIDVAAIVHEMQAAVGKPCKPREQR